MQNKDLLYWIWFAEAVGPANADAIKLLKRYETPYEIFRCEEFEMDLFPGLSEHTRAMLEKKDLYSASKIYEACEKYKIRILTYSDACYPNALRDIPEPPVLLYYRGTIPDWNRCLCIGVVGTRKMTAYGMRFAYKIAYEMAAVNTIVVSGMASGIDGVAAAAALAAHGKTVAVLGSGLDCIYPAHHRRLRDQIIQSGIVLSEYPPGTQIKPYHFPVRNRIISGLSQGTVVVEAGAGSGSLITARLAMKQGRDVFAVPSNIGRDGADGANELLREGAALVLESEDILDRYQYIYVQALRPERLPDAKKHSSANLNDLQNLGVAVFRSSDQRKGGAPYIPIAVPDLSTTFPIEPPAVSAVGNMPPRDVPMTAASVSTSLKRHSSRSPVSNSNAETRTVELAPQQGATTERSAESESLSPIQREILKTMPADRSVSADQLSHLAYPYSDIIAALTVLEIMGWIEKLPGALYRKRGTA